MRIGIDLGGTKIEGIALGDDGRELARQRIPTPQGDYDGTVRGIASVATGMIAKLARLCERRSVQRNVNEAPPRH